MTFFQNIIRFVLPYCLKLQYNFQINLKGVIQRIILFDEGLAYAERCPFTPMKLKLDAWLKSYKHIKTSANAICPIL
jgi:hypothetical protein